MGNQDAHPPSALRAKGRRLLRTVPTARPFRLLSVLALLLLTCHSATAAAQNPRRVLLIYAEEKDLPMNLIIDSQLRSSFREQLGDGVAVFSEYTDVSRFPDSRYNRRLLEFLRDKYSAHGLDLIVVIESSVLDQIQLHRDWFFPNTPIVFCCVTQAEYKARRIGPGVTGIPANLDYRPTLDLALKLHPRTRRVVVIAGATREDAETLADVRGDFRPFEDAVEFRYLVGFSMPDLRQEISQLSADTIIIYLSIAQDGAGTYFLPREALEQISQVATVPIYGYYDSYLGHGIVGGFVASFEIEATNAARLGLRILAGDKPEDLSTKEATSCAYMFDWGQLKRWGIDEKDLPPSSVVRFRNPSFWELYHWQIISVLSLCAIQAMLIFGLLIQRARRRRAEKEIRQAEERFRTVVESAFNAVAVVNAVGKIVLVNAQCERFFGYRREELVGLPVEMLVPERFRTEHSSGGQSFFALPSAPPMEGGRELFGKRKNGSEFPVEIHVTPMQTGGGSLILCVIEDITARRQAEEARQELAHSSRLAIVGELTASIAHEINQPLGAILCNVGAATMRLKSSPPALDKVEQILDDIRKDDLRASEVIRRLRTLLRKKEIESQPVDLNEVASEVVSLIRPESARRGVAVEMELASGLPLVHGDKIHLQQVVLNLALNGMDAMEERTGKKTLGVRTSWKEEGLVEVAVSDTGEGIPLDRFPHLFNQFFSTKRKGMGLGLSIARSLVETHGGRIWAENNSQGGATFRFALLARAEQPGQESQRPEEACAEVRI
jgi:PAS domain S-box-containing protein